MKVRCRDGAAPPELGMMFQESVCYKHVAPPGAWHHRDGRKLNAEPPPTCDVDHCISTGGTDRANGSGDVSGEQIIECVSYQNHK